MMLDDFIASGKSSFMIEELEWLKRMNEIYTIENLELFKAYLIVHTLNAADKYLDEECLTLVDEYNSHISGREVDVLLDERAYKICMEILDMAVGRMYADAYVDDETRQDVTDMVHSVVEVYKSRLKNITWLGETTKAKAVEKLDKLKICVCAPEDWSFVDYSGLDLTPYDKGGTLISNIIAIDNYLQAQTVEFTDTPVNEDEWIAVPNVVNASCYPQGNSIYILDGILGGVIYNKDASYEENLGGIGVIIGHEITHLFDIQGSLFDADGNLKSWWTSEDRAEFEKRTKAVIDYYGAIEIVPGLRQNGNRTVGEAVADLGGMSCVLEIARKTPDFDYEKFFTQYARVWAEKMPLNVVEQRMQNEHNVGYQRVNVVVQQNEEFYETFGVKEGDGMYLAPEYRLKVW